MKIAVVVDSGSAMTKEEAEQLGIYFLPLQIIDDDKTYLDGENITKEELGAMLNEGKMLKTSLPPLNLIVDLLNKLKKEGYEHVISVPLTSGISSTMSTMIMMAEDVGIDISCIETYTTAYIQKYIAVKAKELADKGLDADEIVRRLNESVAHSNTYLIVEDLETLKRGGRLTPVAAALAGMLKIRPILKLNKSSEGRVDTHAKVRTTKKALMKAVEDIDANNEINKDDYLVAILDGGGKETTEEFKSLYFSKYADCEQIEGDLASVILCHTGTGSVGIQYIKKVQE